MNAPLLIAQIENPIPPEVSDGIYASLKQLHPGWQLSFYLLLAAIAGLFAVIGTLFYQYIKVRNKWDEQQKNHLGIIKDINNELSALTRIMENSSADTSKVIEDRVMPVLNAVYNKLLS